MRLPLEIENNNVSTTNVKVPVRVTMKGPMKVEQGKRLAEYNHRKKEELAQVTKAQEREPKLSQAYGIGAVIAVGVLGLLFYYIYQSSSPGDNNATKVNLVQTVEVQIQKRANNFEIE